jgi:hypothetical protein
MFKIRFFTSCILVFCCGSGAARHHGDSLDAVKAGVLYKVQKAFHLPVCGNVSLEQCIRDSLPCPLAPRLSEFAYWLAGHGNDSAFIAEKLAERYASLAGKRTYDIDCSLFKSIGDSTAPIVLTIYISIGCPACKQVCSFLYDSVTAGSLKGRARLCVKLLTATNRDMALLAANECGMFWKFIKRVAAISQRLDKNVLLEAAESIGAPMRKFKAAMRSDKLRERALASRNEALANGVKATPTLFINGRRYDSYNHPDWIVDAVEYEYRRIVTDSEVNPR